MHTAPSKSFRRLKNLARSGRTVIISIHAPRSEIWGLLDRVVLLSKGSTLYSGPTKEQFAILKMWDTKFVLSSTRQNFWWTLQRLTGGRRRPRRLLWHVWKMLKKLGNRRSSHIFLQKKRPIFFLESSQVHGVGFKRQLLVMARRTMKTTLRDPMGMAGCVLQSTVMALVYGWIFFKLDTDEAGITEPRRSNLHRCISELT